MGIEAKRIKRKLKRLLGTSYNDMRIEGDRPNVPLHQAQRQASYYGGRILAFEEVIGFIDKELKKV